MGGIGPHSAERTVDDNLKVFLGGSIVGAIVGGVIGEWKHTALPDWNHWLVDALGAVTGAGAGLVVAYFLLAIFPGRTRWKSDTTKIPEE